MGRNERKKIIGLLAETEKQIALTPVDAMRDLEKEFAAKTASPERFAARLEKDRRKLATLMKSRKSLQRQTKER